MIKGKIQMQETLEAPIVFMTPEVSTGNAVRPRTWAGWKLGSIYLCLMDSWLLWNEADYLPATVYQKLTSVDEEGKFYTLYKVCMATVVADALCANEDWMIYTAGRNDKLVTKAG